MSRPLWTYNRRHPDPGWFSIVREGDVLRSPSGSLRVVRNVTRDDDYWDMKRDGTTGRKPGPSCGTGRLVALSFVKRRCSRYPDPTTVYMRTELRRWEYVGARVKLDQPWDEEIARACHQWDDSVLRQCDVVGVMP